jgi:hypothetical protein
LGLPLDHAVRERRVSAVAEGRHGVIEAPPASTGTVKVPVRYLRRRPGFLRK